jgi:1-acyl-sn-glycerol-3-phosphate acyltransferase
MRLRAFPKLATMILVTAVLVLPLAAVRATGTLTRRPIPRAALLIASLWSGLLCKILGLRVDVSGRPPHGRYVLVANHLSYLDIWVLLWHCPSVFVAKGEISGWPVFGWIARLAGTLFVDQQSRGDVVRIGRRMTELLRAGIPLTLFPEGAASSGMDVRPFMPSLLEPAASTGTPCFGAALTYETTDPSIAPGDHICWHDSSSFLTHILRVAGAKDLRATVQFTDAAVRSDDRKELARVLRETVTSSFVPVRQA